MEEQKALTVEEVVAETRAALEDCFVATVTQKENSLILRFISGEVFEISVKEIK